MDSVQRFSARVGDYARFRPAYPEALFRTLVREAALPAGATVADVGSGTGISAEPLLRRGLRVVAVEPNAAMRAAAEARLGALPGFRSVDGAAEATTLPAGSVHLVAAGQAFHWFRPDEARREFLRILRPDGCVALFWYRRRAEASAFLRGYEALLRRHATDYRAVDPRNVDAAALRGFFGRAPRAWRFDAVQDLDRDGLRGLLGSASYLPAPGGGAHRAAMADADRLFRRHARGGRVRVLYDVDLFLDRPEPSAGPT